jgi:hypothetical protein
MQKILKHILPVRPYLYRKPNVVATSNPYLPEKQGLVVLNPVGDLINSFWFYDQHCQSYRQVTIDKQDLNYRSI